MIAAAPAKAKKDMKLFERARTVNGPALFFKSGEVLLELGHAVNEQQRYQFESEKAIFLRFYPAYEDQPTVGRAKLKAIFRARKPCPMSLTIGGLASENSYGSIIFDSNGNSSIVGLTQGFPSGELWGVNSQPFKSAVRPGFKGEPESFGYLGMISMEKLFVRTLENFVIIASEHYQLRPPFVIEGGGTGLLGVYAAVPSVEVPSGEFVGPFRVPSLNKMYVINKLNKFELFDVLRQLFDEFYDLAACSRSEVLTDAHVVASQLPPRT